MNVDEAVARHLDALHAVVTAACAVVYNDLARPSHDADELRRAIAAEAQAARALSRARLAETASQPPLMEVA